MGLNLRNRALVERENPRALRHLADDKIRAKAVLAEAGVPTPRTLVATSSLGEVPQTLERLSRETAFVIKPARGAGGRGILVIVGHDGDAFLRADNQRLAPTELRRHLAEIVFGAYSRTLEDVALVESLVRQHPALRVLSPAGLCDVRVLVLKGRPVLAMARIPTRRSAGRANLHAGGLGLAVDLDSGRVGRALQRGRVLDHHPDTGLELAGRVLPHWPELLGTAVRAARAFPLGYLGVDLCVDETRGPLVLEVNVRAGLEIQNVCAATLPEALEVLR